MNRADPPAAPQTADALSPLRFEDGTLFLLDQTRLPGAEEWLACRTPADVADAIRRLAVRGAPAIGVAAAYALALAFGDGGGEDDLEARFREAHDRLAATRPTAHNLGWALRQGRDAFERARGGGAGRVYEALLELARRLHREDVEANRRIGRFGAELFDPGDRVLTHCNTGALATAGYGTALGVIRASWEAGRLAQVWVDETRPLLQGSRLTAWELGKLGIPYRLVTDSAAGSLMARRLVERIVVGADRIAANGDVANKIGTYTLAVLAERHGVPFYVAAPLSTFDPETATGADIPIEERDPGELGRLGETPLAPEGAAAANWAFDVTPAALVTAFITDAGILRPPYPEAIAAAFAERWGSGG